MAVSLTRSDVDKVALLSRLRLDDDELDRMTEQLGAILGYVERLSEVNTSGVEPMAHAVERTNVFRDDVETPMLPREAALANAPKSDGQFFLVPQILDAGE
jgi:aspartyl-tRNA(Asn)/glutamyl-tRNA(Gln) amidotransferase subunit C